MKRETAVFITSLWQWHINMQGIHRNTHRLRSPTGWRVAVNKQRHTHSLILTSFLLDEMKWKIVWQLSKVHRLLVSVFRNWHSTIAHTGSALVDVEAARSSELQASPTGHSSLDHCLGKDVTTKGSHLGGVTCSEHESNVSVLVQCFRVCFQTDWHLLSI